ncbi:MAG: hypothetical protein JWO22_1838 [Frankiales bacterium]|nr:hypothetical protein [Frankiales bacterium]
MTAVSTTAPDTGTRRRATYRSTALVLLVGIALATAQSQVHHHYAPKDAGGWRELPTYVITGLIAYGLVCLGLWRVAKQRHPSTTSRTSLLFGLLSAVLFIATYWTPLPFTWAVTGILLSRDADATEGTSRSAIAGRALGALGVLLTLGLLVYRLTGGNGHT